MGEYAEFANGTLMNDYFRDIDNPDPDDNWIDGQTIYVSLKPSEYPLEKNFDYIKMPLNQLKLNDVYLMRKGIELTCKLNQTVIIKAITEKAVLFEFEEEWFNTLHWQMQGLQFWLPKSILYKHKEHKKIIYVPQWTTINIINKPNEEQNSKDN